MAASCADCFDILFHLIVSCGCDCDTMGTDGDNLASGVTTWPLAYSASGSNVVWLLNNVCWHCCSVIRYKIFCKIRFNRQQPTLFGYLSNYCLVFEDMIVRTMRLN